MNDDLTLKNDLVDIIDNTINNQNNSKDNPNFPIKPQSKTNINTDSLLTNTFDRSDKDEPNNELSMADKILNMDVDMNIDNINIDTSYDKINNR